MAKGWLIIDKKAEGGPRVRRQVFLKSGNLNFPPFI
jgi:hypothetical protein